MNRIILVLIAIFVFSTSAQATTYQIDPAHTEVSFKVKHLGLSNVRGKFVDFSGTIEFDPKNIGASQTTASIKTSSVDTSNEKRDNHLRSGDFFNADKNPLMSFKSTKVENVNASSFVVVGDLKLNNISKPVRLNVEHTGSVIDPWGNQRVGFHATTKINRKDFGLSWNKLLETGGLVVGEEVQIEIALEAIKDK